MRGVASGARETQDARDARTNVTSALRLLHAMMPAMMRVAPRVIVAAPVSYGASAERPKDDTAIRPSCDVAII
jgi:hypothetical protein